MEGSPPMYGDLELSNDDTGGSHQRDSDDSQFANQPEEKGYVEQLLGEADPPIQPTKETSEKFTVKEDNLLVFAWLETSMDGVQDTEQSCSTYSQRIHDYFHAHKDFDSDRNSNSLMHRRGIILECVNRFCQCYDEVQNVWESLITEQDKVLEACQLYKEKGKHSKSFDFLHCWNILQHEEKWTDRSSRQKTTSNSSLASFTAGSNESYEDKDEDENDDEEDNGDDEVDDLSSEPANTRQHCKENEAEEFKEIKRKAHSDEEIAFKKIRIELIVPQQKSPELIAVEKRRLVLNDIEHRMLELRKKKLELRKRELEFNQRLSDDRIMMMNISGMNELQQRYFSMLKKEILARFLSKGSG